MTTNIAISVGRGIDRFGDVDAFTADQYRRNYHALLERWLADKFPGVVVHVYDSAIHDSDSAQAWADGESLSPEEEHRLIAAIERVMWDVWEGMQWQTLLLD